MPKARAVDGGHGVLTDHAIPRRAQKEAESARVKTLVPFRGYTATARELGLAYAELGKHQEAEKLLQSLPADAAVAVALRQWQRALALNPHDVVALVNLGAQQAAAGNVAEAERLWREALRRNPGQTAAAANLITLFEATGRKQEARAIRTGLALFEPQYRP